MDGGHGGRERDADNVFPVLVKVPSNQFLPRRYGDGILGVGIAVLVEIAGWFVNDIRTLLRPAVRVGVRIPCALRVRIAFGLLRVLVARPRDALGIKGGV